MSSSPSPAKRPSLTHRNSSTQSLSSSGKQLAHKVHRPHVVGVGRGHGRNVSYGRNLSKLGKINSSSNLLTDARPGHQRKKSSISTPSTSPKAPPIKRNASHVALPKNTSHSNLRKNQSATTLSRNGSHQVLKRGGLAPPLKQKDKYDTKAHDVFQLGDHSSDGEEEEEAEWEDSNTLSPEFTRNNSKASTPARVTTPNEERPPPQKPPDLRPLHQEKTSSPPAPSLHNNNRSAPDLSQRAAASSIGTHPIADPSLLHNNPRSSRAPPVMTTVSARAETQLPRTESTRSFDHISHSEAHLPEMSLNTRAGASSSADGGVSHFLSNNTPQTVGLSLDDGSDYDSPANFLANYKPLASESPDQSRGNKKPSAHVISRVQQRMELQRRETMRGGGAPSASSPSAGTGFSIGSSASLHSRSNSRGRNRAAAGEAKAMRREFETAARQLQVVRRFRNPILESLTRLKDLGSLPNETGAATPGAGTTKSRPQSRRGLSNAMNGAAKPISRSYEDETPTSDNVRSGRGGKMVFPRQGSHDDIALSQSKGSEEGEEEGDGLSREEAMVRRIWETREVFDRPVSAMGMSRESIEVR